MSDWIIEDKNNPAAKPDKAFFDRADGFIDVANTQMDKAGHDSISMSFLYAAARFKAFSTSVSMNGATNMALGKEKIVDDITEDFRQMLMENINEHIRREALEKGGL